MTVKKTILLTGGSGRIGSTCFNALCEVYNFVVTDLKAPDYGIGSPHRFIAADLSQPGAAATLLADANPDAIVPFPDF